MATNVRLFKFPVSSPADTTPLQSLATLGYSASDIIAVAGKTEGNGCVNEYAIIVSPV
jgi:cyanuric acid amidohydrolase